MTVARDWMMAPFASHDAVRAAGDACQAAGDVQLQVIRNSKSAARMRPALSLLAVLAAAGSAGAALADPPSYTLTIRNHQFQPTELRVPAGQKIVLRVINQDPSAEEFESTDLHREKIVTGGARITVYVGPLAPGSYTFFGDFHPDTARGHIVAQ